MGFAEGGRTRGLLGWLAGVSLLAAQPVQAQWATQSLTLEAGWNAVFLQVAPSPSVCDQAFAGHPRVLSVRQWYPARTLEDTLFDEGEGTAIPDRGSWLTWFPAEHPNRVLMDLNELEPGRTYLVEVASGESVDLTLRGRPVAAEHDWLGDAHHLVGLPVPPASSVDFTTFFAPAIESIPVAFQHGGEIYQVQPDGSHARIFQPTLSQIVPGHAYWIRAERSTRYSGPLRVTVETPERWLDFRDRLVPLYVELRNETEALREVHVTHDFSISPPTGEEPIAGRVPLRYAVETPLEAVFHRTYRDFPSTWTTQLQAGASIRLAFLPDANDLVAGAGQGDFQSILSFADGEPGQATVLQRVAVRAASRASTAEELQGLWVGEAVITDVARLEMLGVIGQAPFSPVPVARPYRFRLLIHLDDEGTARLLQRVLVGTRPGPDSSGVLTDLLADESLAADYRSTHPGAKVFRVSAANFPFMAPVTLTGGSFAVPVQVLRGDVPMARDDPVNPFRHQYAPLHDNLERRAEADVPYVEDVEVFSVSRHVELLFQPADENNPDPTWGLSSCGGVYREEIYGLGGPQAASNRMLKVEGEFRLERAIPNGAIAL